MHLGKNTDEIDIKIGIIRNEINITQFLIKD
jgi:hypothetical protein